MPLALFPLAILALYAYDRACRIGHCAIAGHKIDHVYTVMVAETVADARGLKCPRCKRRIR